MGKTLADLYVRAADVTVTDDDGETVQVWIRKPHPADMGIISKIGNVQRAKYLLTVRDPSSDEHLIMESQIAAIIDESPDGEGFVNFLTALKMVEQQPAIEAECAAADEWAKDDYLPGLRDAWEENLKDVYAKDPADPEAARVFSEMQRFLLTVDQAVATWRDKYQAELRRESLDSLAAKVRKEMIHQAGQQVWYEEYERQRFLRCVMQPEDHKTQYFSSVEEIDMLAPEVKRQLNAAFGELFVGAIQGK